MSEAVNRFAAPWAVLILVAGLGARAASCRCTPCPLVGPAAGRHSPAPSCGGEPAPEPSCHRARFAETEGDPPEIDAAPGADVIEAAIPAVTHLHDAVGVVLVTPRGTGPRPPPLPIYLRDLSLQL